MTRPIRTSSLLAVAILATGCGSDDLFHLSSVAHGLSIREQAQTRLAGGADRLSQATVVGDLDGDGYDDAVVRDDQFRLEGELWQRGAARVLYGGPALGTSVHMGSLPGLIGDRPYGGGSGLRTVVGVGDVDGDGLADLLVGDSTNYSCSELNAGDPPDPCALPEDAMHGRAYLIYGSRTRLIGDTPLGQAGAELRDPVACTDFGAALMALGDLDHDGFADFGVVSSDVPADRDAFLGLGNLHVFYGGPTRLSGRHEASEAQAVIQSPPDAMGFAWSTAAAGDVDGDGFGDLLLSDQAYGGFSNTPAHGIGHAYVVRGGAARLTGTLDVNAIASTTITGDDLGGFALAGLGDLDGDGAGEFAVVAAGAELRVDRTVYYVFYGRMGGLPAQLSIDSADAHLLAAEGGWGMTPLASGDVDGDGRRDLIMGDSNLGDSRGGVYVRLGDGARLAGAVDLASEGTTYQGATVHVPCPHTSDWDGQENCTSQEYVGAWVGTGDLDGDGRTDVLASAPTTEGFSSVYLLASKAP